MHRRFVTVAALALAAAISASGAAARGHRSAALVFPIPAGTCPKLPCKVEPYPADSGEFTPYLYADIPAGAAARGWIQGQVLEKPGSALTVMYSAFNEDRTVLQTLWITVIPSHPGYRVSLTTCPGLTGPPCKV